MSIDSVGQEAGSDAGLATDGECDEDFENLIDVPYITLNRVGGEYQAEVMMEGTEAECEAMVDWLLAHAEMRGLLCTSVYPNEDNDAILMEFVHVGTDQ